MSRTFRQKIAFEQMSTTSSAGSEAHMLMDNVIESHSDDRLEVLSSLESW